jgi:hypothetical protein
VGAGVTCVLCAKGTFNDRPGVPSCPRCPKDQTTTLQGSTSRNNCTDDPTIKVARAVAAQAQAEKDAQETTLLLVSVGAVVLILGLVPRGRGAPPGERGRDGRCTAVACGCS